jgi:hypothetical protein
VLIGVAHDMVPTLDAALRTVYGHTTKSWHSYEPVTATYGMEFITTGRPRKPWDYCGETVLFHMEQEVEEEKAALAAKFKEGDPVRFQHEGTLKHGLVARVSSRRVTVAVKGEATLYVPGKDLAIDE